MELDYYHQKVNKKLPYELPNNLGIKILEN